MAYTDAERQLLGRILAYGSETLKSLDVLIQLRDDGKRGDVEIELTQDQITAMQADYDSKKSRFKAAVASF